MSTAQAWGTAPILEGLECKASAGLGLPAAGSPPPPIPPQKDREAQVTCFTGPHRHTCRNRSSEPGDKTTVTQRLRARGQGHGHAAAGKGLSLDMEVLF